MTGSRLAFAIVLTLMIGPTRAEEAKVDMDLVNVDHPADTGEAVIGEAEVKRSLFKANTDEPNCGGTSPEQLSGSSRGARCLRMCIKLPLGKTLAYVKYYAGDRPPNPPDCNGLCDIGGSKWFGAVEFHKDTRRICSHFKNWSENSRYIRMEVYYK